jgi:chromosome segregation ATPase
LEENNEMLSNLIMELETKNKSLEERYTKPKLVIDKLRKANLEKDKKIHELELHINVMELQINELMSEKKIIKKTNKKLSQLVAIETTKEIHEDEIEKYQKLIDDKIKTLCEFAETLNTHQSYKPDGNGYHQSKKNFFAKLEM